MNRTWWRALRRSRAASNDAVGPDQLARVQGVVGAFVLVGLGVFLVLPLVTEVIDHQRWPQVAAATAALLCGLPVIWRWDRRRSDTTLVALAATGVAWLIWVFASDPETGTGVWGLPFAACLAVVAAGRSPDLTYGLPAALIGAPLVVHRLGVSEVHPDGLVDVVYVGLAYLVAVGTLDMSNRLVVASKEMERARHAAADLATAEERLRVARDLHDIQGHTMQAIAFKAELAGRLVDRDPAAAKTHMEAVRGLAAQGVRDTRGLAHGYRFRSLGAELASARALLEAADIATHFGDPPGEGDDEAVSATLFATVVRESCTNILRHAAATWVTIEFVPGSMTVRNDGADPGTVPTGNGILGLDERLREKGGSVTAAVRGTVFELRAVLPVRGGEQSETDTGEVQP